MPRSRSPSFSAVAPRSSWLQARARARLRATGTDPGRLGPDLAAADACAACAVAIPQAATIPEPVRCATVRPASHRRPAPPRCWKSPTRPGNHLRLQVPLAPNRSHCSRSMNRHLQSKIRTMSGPAPDRRRRQLPFRLVNVGAAAVPQADEERSLFLQPSEAWLLLNPQVGGLEPLLFSRTSHDKHTQHHVRHPAPPHNRQMTSFPVQPRTRSRIFKIQSPRPGTATPPRPREELVRTPPPATPGGRQATHSGKPENQFLLTPSFRVAHLHVGA